MKIIYTGQFFFLYLGAPSLFKLPRLAAMDRSEGEWVEERFFWSAHIVARWIYLSFCFNLPKNGNNTGPFLCSCYFKDRIEHGESYKSYPGRGES